MQEGIYFDDKRGEYRSMNLRAIEASDALDLNLRLQGWQARAALAQPSPALPPFAEKVLAKLRRFYDCASDFESGGVDIGRHWLDLLTQLGLLNRVQRSPALWEISQQGEDLLGMPQLSPAQAEQAEAGRSEVERLREENANLILACASLDSEKREMRHKWDAIIAMRDAALARVAELERGKVYVEARQCDECQHGGINDSATGVAACHECDWTGPEPEEDRCPGCQRENCMAAACPQCGARYVLVASEEIAAPVAQAQQLNDLDKQCRDDVARALGLRPNQERGFAWSYLLASIKSCVKASGDSAQAQHSVPETTNEEANSFLRVADAGQFKDNAGVAVVPERKLLNAGVPGLNRNSGWNACLDELARINGMTVSEGLVQGMAKFAREIICGALEGGSFDGAEIQESAERHGLIAKQVMNEPCRGPEEYCACAWSTSFPAECCRVTPELRALLSEQEGGKQ
ncbi:hypothetical protein CSB89_1340 [Pseudomonas aeruginosa]|nr:hypothetical protein CSB89_1340 [Pseudomonas aeruginosa]